MKSLQQRIMVDQSAPKTAVFIVGCQRSGTSMLLRLLDNPLQVFIYGETDRPAMQKNCRLAPQNVIESIIRRNSAQTIVFKPICDSHWTDRLLTTHQGSKAIWIYRHFYDVVNSSLRKWTGQLVNMEKMANGDWDRLDWRVERLADSDLAMVKECYQGGITRVDATALEWILRTSLFERMELYAEPRVRLVKYEELVSEPVRIASAVFQFLDIPFRQEFVDDIHNSSMQKNEPPTLSPRVRELCKALQTRMDELYRAQNETAQNA